MTSATLSAFRLAAAEDAPTIGAFQIQAWRDNYVGLLPSWVTDGFSVEERVAAWRQILRRPAFHDNAFVVLTADDAGIAALGAASGQRAPRLKALGYTGQLEALYVRRDLQHNGLGRQILGRMFVELAARGHRSASHWLMRKNLRGEAFLAATGAQRISLASTRSDAESDLAFGWRDIGRPDSLTWRDPRSRLAPEAAEDARAPNAPRMGRAADLSHDRRRRVS